MRCKCCGHIIPQKRRTKLDILTDIGDELSLSGKRERGDGSHYYAGGIETKERLEEILLKIKKLKEKNED